MNTPIKIFVTCLALLTTCVELNCQITEDTTYPDAQLHLLMVNLEMSGMKYVFRSKEPGNRFLKFYNLDHSLWKTIDCNPLPTTTSLGSGTEQFNFDALYISENLFDCDDKIEFLYGSRSDSEWFSGIYNENGVALLVADSCAPLVNLNIPQQQRPIYNTPDGTKLILSHKNGSAIVYNLPCSLSVGIDQISPDPLGPYLKSYPNPASSGITIEYSIPSGEAFAEIIIHDMGGKEIKRYLVDRTFSSLVLEKNALNPGIYMYSIVVNGQILESKKQIVLN